jgi:pimeloyl-ACP methyl ester carboxylesterase
MGHVGGPNGLAALVGSAAMHEPMAIPVESSDGVTVVAHDHGGEGPPMVFCHATGFHGRYWDPICIRLAESYRCITIDLRGHGDSVVPVGLDMNWNGMGDDVLAVLDTLGLSEVRAVGHSMGGCAILIAELARPGSIIGAWLCEPIVMPPDRDAFFPNDDNPMVAAALKRREIFDSRDAVFDRYGSRPPFSGVEPEALRAYVDHGFADQADGTVILKCRGKVEAAVFSNSQTDVHGRLGEIRTPTVVAGSGDGDGPANIAPVVADQLPNATFEHFGDLTHFAPMEDPQRIAQSIQRALA